MGEMVAVFLSVAQAHASDGRCVDQSAQVNRCYQVLAQLKQVDSTAKVLPESARRKLFQEIDHVRSVGKDAAQSHIDAANQLREDAEGKHWWSFNDQDKQMAALHRVNLAWSYYPAHCDEGMVNAMYEAWADMKGKLATWRYNQVMERDRLQLGRVVGDR